MGCSDTPFFLNGHKFEIIILFAVNFHVVLKLSFCDIHCIFAMYDVKHPHVPKDVHVAGNAGTLFSLF